MVNKCVVLGCKSGYYSQKRDPVSSFGFPFNKPYLLDQWIDFVNRLDWKPTKNSVICAKHFENKFILAGKRTVLKWKLNPVPTLYASVKEKELPIISEAPTSSQTFPLLGKKEINGESRLDLDLFPVAKDSLTLHTSSSSKSFRSLLKVRICKRNKDQHRKQNDLITSFDDISETNAPQGYLTHKTSKYIVFYKLIFNDKTNFPEIVDAIKINKNLNVELLFRGDEVPLPLWFTKDENCTIKRFSMLDDFLSYLSNLQKKGNFFIEEMKKHQYYSENHSYSYSLEFLRFAFFLFSTSKQAYQVVLDHLPFPSIQSLKQVSSIQGFGEQDC